MENLEIEITNHEKYTDADISGITHINGFGALIGDVCVEINGEMAPFTGEHGRCDYEDDYGFVIKNTETE